MHSKPYVPADCAHLSLIKMPLSRCLTSERIWTVWNLWMKKNVIFILELIPHSFLHRSLFHSKVHLKRKNLWNLLSTFLHSPFHPLPPLVPENQKVTVAMSAVHVRISAKTRGLAWNLCQFWEHMLVLGSYDGFWLCCFPWLVPIHLLQCHYIKCSPCHLEAGRAW